MIYLDTSVLLPFYRNEILSEKIQAFLNLNHKSVMISELTLIEFSCALARWTRTKELTEHHAAIIEKALNTDINNNCFAVKPLSSIVYKQARVWLVQRKTALKAFDALHLATSFSLNAKLITADWILASAANTFAVPSELISQ